MTDAPALSGLLARIAEVAGEDAALLCARAFGGRPFYFPIKPEADHALVCLVGEKKALAICAAIGPGDVTLPRGPWAPARAAVRHAVELLQSGKSQSAVAAATQLHIRTVEKISARLKHRDRRQLKLL